MLINLNGIKLYYERTGNGPNIIFLHGNGENSQIFNKIVSRISMYYTVYTVDSRGHGNSTPIKELHYEDMCEDVYLFISRLGIKNPIIYGFSDGGIIGLLLAINHPELISGLIASGVNINPKGLKKKYLRLFKFLHFFNRSDKLKLMINEPNITTEMLNKITVPTLLTAGSNDLIDEMHTKLIHVNIASSSLKIFKNETHDSYVLKNDKLLYFLLNNLVPKKLLLESDKVNDN